MARFTVSDCMENIENRFIMTLVAAVRARQIENGSPILLDKTKNDKPTVLALREIAGKHIDEQFLKNVD